MPSCRPAALPPCRLAVLALLAASPLAAQYDRPPEQGGRVFQLGMPPIWKGHAGATFGWYEPGDLSLLRVMGHAGVMRDLTSPVTGLLAVGVEGTAGYRGDRSLDGGLRALVGVPSFRLTTGLEYNLRDEAFSGILRVEMATRRGGIFNRGSLVRLEWLPGVHHTIAAGVNVPLWGRNIGETRPQRAAARVERPPVVRLSPPAPPPGLDSMVADLRARALAVTRLVTPLVERGGEPAASHAADIAAARDHLAAGGLAAEQEGFHDAMARLFGQAVGSPAAGPAIAARARAILLDEVLLPYNRLLGQRKDPDGLRQFTASATAAFARWGLRNGLVPDQRVAEAGYAFQGLMDVAEAVRAFQRERWGDSRLVWLPLQLGLRAEEHDTQAELDDLLERGTGERFTTGNQVWYVMNEAFQTEFARSVFAAEDYHVLWVHDYRGLNGRGEPDRVGFAQTVDVYLGALTRRVREYDRTGRLPQYFIFLDQIYFEGNHSRLWLAVLQDPLHARLDLPRGFEAMEQQFRDAQAALREAVEGSRVLQAELRQYGRRWLRNRIRVHINVTNPADQSFTSNRIAGILPVPDNVMRDHRKIAFYDITEDDPWRGLAMYTGMGIGEHYAGRNWEDRALLLQGPAALGVKDAARELLEQQGFRPSEIPLALRARPLPPDWAARADSAGLAQAGLVNATGGRILQLHNQTGYAAKPVNVQKAILYSLLPAGSVLKVPDSLWQSWLYASLLTGSALRGCKVLVIAPSLASAPSTGAPVMARAHGLLSALLAWQQALGEPIAGQGGLLRVGLYAPRVGVGDLPGRIRQAWSLDAPWLQDVVPDNPVTDSVARAAVEIFEAAGLSGAYLVEADTLESPKLHLKANFFAGGRSWTRLMAEPAWGPVVREYLLYLARQQGPPEGRLPARQSPARLTQAVLALIRATDGWATAEDRRTAISYFTIGSANLNYRSMVADGEVELTVTGWGILAGLLDFVQLVGLSEWPETQEQLDRLLPPPGGLTRSVASLLRLLL